ncbi:unnamed protein product [Cunninghamella blakesleeana]
MIGVPFEILYIIFMSTTQRTRFSRLSLVCKQLYETVSQPLFYSTIELLSKNQLKGFIEFAKTKTIHCKPIGIYVYHIKFEMHITINEEEIQELITVFPNLKSIDNAYRKHKFRLNEPVSDYYHPPVCQKLIDYSNWITAKNVDWMNDLNDNKRKIKSIDMEIYDEMIYSNNSPSPPIHIKPNGEPKHLPFYLNHIGENKMIQNQILVLPTLNHLMHLEINFSVLTAVIGTENNNYDENTFEMIHGSCPQLESLVLKGFSFYLSDDFDKTKMNNYNSSTFKSAHYLKEININGEFYDPNCYTYLSKKYPQIESLILTLGAFPILIADSNSYRISINDMLNHFQFLNKLGIYLYDKGGFIQKTHVDMMGKVFCPDQEFLQWILQHPTKVSHLTYCNQTSDRYDDRVINVGDHSRILDIRYTYEKSIERIIQQYDFLHHLTYLSFTPAYFQDILLNYFRRFDQEIILSPSIKELTIIDENDYKTVDVIFIYDYLDVLPNLNSLTIMNVTFSNDFNDINLCKNDNIGKFTCLHTKIEQQKYGQLPLLQQQTNVLNSTTIYHLIYLSFEKCTIIMKDGLNEGLFKKLPHLKHLKFNHVQYGTKKLKSYDGVDFFDLSHLSLETLQIIFFNYTSKYSVHLSKEEEEVDEDEENNDNDGEVEEKLGFIAKLTVNETELDKKSILFDELRLTSKPTGNYYPMNLHVICKYVDKLIFM